MLAPMRYAMIMAGGAGTRLWPMSRTLRPKQLLPIIQSAATPAAARAGGSSPAAAREQPVSLLEIAAARVEGLVEPSRRFICTSELFREQIRAGLPSFSDDRILGEPAARDTVNAVGFAAAVFQKLDKNAVFIVLTADHLIAPEDVFRQRAELAFKLVEHDPRRLVTFSIQPTFAATGFGYVERGTPIEPPLAYRVARFVEKPDAARAQAYVESGQFAWNSGMFVFHAGTFMDCLKRFKPESYDGLMKIQSAWGTKTQETVLNAVYPTLPRISVDYAVMEPASTDKLVSVCTVITDVDWLDVGSWPSFGQTLVPDAKGNRLGGAVRSVLVDCQDTLVVGESAPGASPHTLALLGMKDVIVVHTPDATLVMPRSHAEQLKKLHGLVADDLK
jgi:mannose-1-phosphate guanylyltransferase